MIWKLSTNKKLFDYELARKAFKKNGSFVLYQSKGRARMVTVPHIGDKVIIVCDKKEVLKGIVRSEFQEGTMHQDTACPFSKGGDKNHREKLQYLTIEITGLGDMVYNRGVQRTWSKYK